MIQHTTTLENGAVRMELDESLYPRDAVYGAAYAFIDRCYVHLDRVAAGRIAVDLRLKAAGQTADAGVLEAMAAELQDELLGQAWRHQIIEQNRSLIESVSMRALGGAAGPTLDHGAGGSLDDLLAADDAVFDDPLGIAMSWEQKYAKKGDAPADPSGEEGGGA